MATAKQLFDKRKQRNRGQVRKKSVDRPRLSVFRSNKHIYVQVIDDAKSATLATASTLEKELRGKFTSGSCKDAAQAVGKLIAGRAQAAGVKAVVFDRGGYRYHGRIKALADAAREGGLTF